VSLPESVSQRPDPHLYKLARASFHVLREQTPFDPKKVFV